MRDIQAPTVGNEGIENTRVSIRLSRTRCICGFRPSEFDFKFLGVWRFSIRGRRGLACVGIFGSKALVRMSWDACLGVLKLFSFRMQGLGSGGLMGIQPIGLSSFFCVGFFLHEGSHERRRAGV